MAKWEVRIDVEIEADDEDTALTIANKAMSAATDDGYITDWILREIH